MFVMRTNSNRHILMGQSATDIHLFGVIIRPVMKHSVLLFLCFRLWFYKCQICYTNTHTTQFFLTTQICLFCSTTHRFLYVQAPLCFVFLDLFTEILSVHFLFVQIADGMRMNFYKTKFCIGSCHSGCNQLQHPDVRRYHIANRSDLLLHSALLRCYLEAAETTGVSFKVSYLFALRWIGHWYVEKIFLIIS